MDEILIINKPTHCSSMDVIRKIRKLTGIKKIGHAGTLDPLASGVLIVCIGKATKQIQFLMDTNKEYLAEIDLSGFSETDDAEGLIQLVEIKQIPDKNEIIKVINSFVGEISQIPPKFSAIKINGVRAYKKALNKEDFILKPRLIKIHSIELLDFQWPILKIKVVCGKGTYIRSLARDIGSKLNTGGYIKNLQRTAIDKFRIEDSIRLDDLKEIKIY